MPGPGRRQLPVPVFWLLGKTQSGKTSLIRVLTRSPAAEIGGGFKACTRTARIYDFPNESECFLRFLDTRGLGEASYDPGEDIALFEKQLTCWLSSSRLLTMRPKACWNRCG